VRVIKAKPRWVAASELGSERVSNERERTSQHVVAEGAGAATTAAFLQAPSDYADAEIVLLVTGANVSPDVLRRAVTVVAVA
jgi:threonine dehydratase